MNQPPKRGAADKRRMEFLSDAKEAARNFTSEWNPDSDDAGAAVLRLFAEMAEDVAERWSHVPEKHRVAFFDALGFSREPAKPARLPLTFTVADGVQGNVVVPDGTRAVAEATDDRPEQPFEIADNEGFEATPAALKAVYSVDRPTDSIFEHWRTLQTGAEIRPFNGEDIQEHALYIGHNDVLTLKGNAGVKVEIRANTGVDNFEKLNWQYYGSRIENGEEIEGWHDLFWETGATRALDGRTEFSFHVPPDGELIETTLPNKVRIESEEVETENSSTTEIETRWIRCRSQTSTPSEHLFATTVNTVSLSPLTDPAGLIPDMLLYNDIPLSTSHDESSATNRDESSTIYPFGQVPRPMDTFYIASQEGFTKKGLRVTVEFREWRTEPDESGENADPDKPGENGDPDGGKQGEQSSFDISWEYWNGSGWDRISGLEVTGPSNDHDYQVTFDVPTDLSSTGVAGHDNYWIRARILDNGHIGYVKNKEKGIWEAVTENVPRFSTVRIGYTDEPAPEPAEHLIADNNGEYKEHATTSRRSSDIRPFTPVPDEKQALYLGFDDELDNGPIQVLFSATDKEFPEPFYPRVRWEYCEDPKNDVWTQLSVRDETESLTRRGIVRLEFAEPTMAFERFGHDLHWLRGRLIGDEFDSSSTPLGSEGSVEIETRSDDANVEQPTEKPEPVLSYETLEPLELAPDPQPTKSPIRIQGIYPNSGWADNVRTVTGETVGSSDGSPSQEFTLGNTPVIRATIWVDELPTLSEEAREEMKRTQPGSIEEVADAQGTLQRFWVRWNSVDDFFDSSADARHYVLNPTLGVLRFGNGQQGRIPPRGTDNIKAEYRTGGGSGGNVKTRTVTGLESPLPFIETVVNPSPGDGGVDAEPRSETLDRASRELRDRGKAVTKEDFERVAVTASRDLARVRCIPGLDRAGTHRAGWVTLLLVPRSQEPKPVPSIDVKERVITQMNQRAPAVLTGANSKQLVVRGPSYVAVTARTAVKTTGAGSISSIEETIIETLEAFLHPLTGGTDGDGWDFGELPSFSAFYALLENVDGVNHVENLELTFQGRDETGQIKEIIRTEEPRPHVPPDALVSSGTHEVIAT